MQKFFMNRELAERLGLPLSRWKRWSREFLPPDPLGGLQSGYARQYSLRDAFAVYLGGYLVAGMGFSIPEARRILQDLNGWLKKNIIPNFDAAAAGEGAPGEEGGRIAILIQPSQGRTLPAYTYRIRTLAARTQGHGGDPPLWQQTYHEAILKPGEPLVTPGFPSCARHLDLSAVARRFFECLMKSSP